MNRLQHKNTINNIQGNVSPLQTSYSTKGDPEDFNIAEA